jgi:hypothetical protein
LTPASARRSVSNLPHRPCAAPAGSRWPSELYTADVQRLVRTWVNPRYNNALPIIFGSNVERYEVGMLSELFHQVSAATLRCGPRS